MRPQLAIRPQDPKPFLLSVMNHEPLQYLTPLTLVYVCAEVVQELWQASVWRETRLGRHKDERGKDKALDHLYLYKCENVAFTNFAIKAFYALRNNNLFKVGKR